MSGLPELIRAYLEKRGDITEDRVLSGDGFFMDGRLRAAVIEDDLCVQVGGGRWDSATTMAGVRPLIVAGRPVKGWVLVDATSISGESDLAGWIENAVRP